MAARVPERAIDNRADPAAAVQRKAPAAPRDERRARAGLTPRDGAGRRARAKKGLFFEQPSIRGFVQWNLNGSRNPCTGGSTPPSTLGIPASSRDLL